MAKNLVIVESPAKAKTIGKFLGPDYTVTSSYGHIRDLKKKNFGIDMANGFEPEYELSLIHISEPTRLVGSEMCIRDSGRPAQESQGGRDGMARI